MFYVLVPQMYMDFIMSRRTATIEVESMKACVCAEFPTIFGSNMLVEGELRASVL
jgi:hypothetical protein